MTLLSIKEWVAFASEICILLITIYTFYLTVISNRIKFLSMNVSSSILEGNCFSVVIENKTLSPIVIKNIKLIVDNKYKIVLINPDSPMILSPYTAKKIASDRFSYTEPDISKCINVKRVLEIETTKKKLYVSLYKGDKKVSKKIKKLPWNVSKIKNQYNGQIIPKSAVFALNVSKQNWNKTVFIFETGVMTGEIFGFNGIPVEDDEKDKKGTIKMYLDEWFKDKDVNYFLDEL